MNIYIYLIYSSYDVRSMLSATYIQPTVLFIKLMNMHLQSNVFLYTCYEIYLVDKCVE